MAETSEEHAARVERVERLYAKCAQRGGGSMADVEQLRNDVRAFATELANRESRLAQARHIIDAQAHRIQGGLDRIAELEADLQHAREGFVDVWLAKRNDELRYAVTVAADLLHRLAGPGPCDVDNDGACRGHQGFASGYLEPCPHPLGRHFVEAWRAVQGEGSTT